MADSHSPLRDVLVAVGVVGAILLVLFIYTGNWPPVVVVESNSMMHVKADEYRGFTGDARAEGTSYGRFGTIDPGDLVLVKEVSKPGDIKTFADGGRHHYGSPGDVVVYRPGGGGGTPIIHRAMTYIWVDDSGTTKRYIVKWSTAWPEPEDAACARTNGNYTCTFGTGGGVTITALSIRGMQPQHSGFITKGDNVATNTQADQVTFVIDNPGTSWNENMRDRPVRADWVQGVARAEIPWFGLIKLALTSGGDASCFPVKNCEMGPHPYFWQIGNVVAPKDEWIMLIVGLVVVTAAPIGVDVALAYRHRSSRKKGSDWTLLEGTGNPDTKKEAGAEVAPAQPVRAEPDPPAE